MVMKFIVEEVMLTDDEQISSGSDSGGGDGEDGDGDVYGRGDMQKLSQVLLKWWLMVMNFQQW